MESLNEHIERMRSLIGSKHGVIKFLSEEDKPKEKDDSKSKDAEIQKQKEIQRKKEEEEKQRKKEEEDKKPEDTNKKEVEQPKDNLNKVISIEDELRLLDSDYDLDLAEELDDFIEDTFFDDDINPLKRKIIDLIKSREDF
jgi:hypothetical protein